MKDQLDRKSDLSAAIAKSIRTSIVDGDLIADDRLPSEVELAEKYGVSRPTVREALKRLAAQSLIRTQRGANGGAFVRRVSYEDAYSQHITTSTLLLSMNEISFEVACEARFALERACVPFAAERRGADHLADMRAEIHRQAQPGLSDEAFCASDVAFHRALVNSAGNPVMAYQLAGAVEAMQPLMNMITYTSRSREQIVGFHTRIADALEGADVVEADAALQELQGYTLKLGNDVLSLRRGAPGKEG